MQIHTINPATGEKLESYKRMSHGVVEDLLSEVDRAWEGWRNTPFEMRAGLLQALAAGLRRDSRSLSTLMAVEMGKPISQGKAEIEKCAWVCEHYAEHGEEYLARQPIQTEARRSYLTYQPLGIVLAIMPWNFPFWQVFRFAAPAIMAGNAVVLKHAANVTGCSLAIENLFAQIDAPPGLFRSLLIGHEEVNRAIAHPNVQAMTLTGSVEAGQALAPRAAAHIKKTVLELGGSDPYLILEDADVPKAIELCVASRMINSGQSCIAAKRFLVVEPVAEEFTEGLTARMGGQNMADPLSEDADLGPLARRDLRDELHAQVLRSIAAGADLILGGEVPAEKGSWYPPTVLRGVQPGMSAFDEELFGPVASVTVVKSEEEAIALANRTVFGLGAAVFTEDLERGERIAAERLEAGCCAVNDFVRSDPRLPFGGIRLSGYGRELGALGIREFVNTKTVVVA